MNKTIAILILICVVPMVCATGDRWDLIFSDGTTTINGTDVCLDDGTCLSNSTGGGGDITAVNTAGKYLTGGVTSGTANLLLNETKLNSTIDARATGLGDNESWNESYANTLYISGTESDLNVNSSNYWDNYNTANETWFENIAGVLNLKLSELTSWTDTWFGTKTTDDLTEGSTNLYDNQTWNESRADDIYVNIDGDTMTGDLSVDGNIIASDYIEGQPMTGSIGSGIISSSENIDNCGCINLSTNSGLNVHYPDLVVRVVNTNGTVVHCDIAEGDITVTDNAHSVYYVNSSCGIGFSSFDTYVNADNSPGDYAQIFDIYTLGGNVVGIKGSTLLELINRKSRQINIFCSSSSHLSVCNGIDITTNGFPEFNVSSGNIVYINTYLPVNGKSSLNDGLHYVYHEGGNWVHTDETGLNITHCDDGTNLVECTGNNYRQYPVYNINWDIDTVIHQIAPLLSGNTYSTLAACLEATPDYTLPNNEEHLAVVHHIYCAKRTESLWNSDAWIDLRAEPVGTGGTPDLSIYLDVFGDKPLQSNWGQGAFNLTNTDSWFLGKIAWDTIQNKFITAVTGYIYMDGTTATLNETRLNATIDDRDSDTTYSHLTNFTDDLGDRGYTSNLNFTNDANYWNDTHATFNKTYADSLYADISVTGDNSSWNETYADSLYVNVDGDTMTGDLDMEDNDMNNINTINVSNITYVHDIYATDGNSINIIAGGDADDYLSVKNILNRPTIKREGGKFIYFESSNVYDVGISFRADDTYSGTLNYEKDNHMMTMLGKNSPLGFKANSEYNNYIVVETKNHQPEISVYNGTKLVINDSLEVVGMVNASGKVYSEGIEVLTSYSDTNASTACSGSTTYLDGEGNCDDISGVYAPINYGDDWNKTYADGLYAGIGVTGDNSSWNETYADTLYRLDSWDNLTGIPHATPSDGDTTHFSLADEIYDWVISLGYLTSLSNIFDQWLNTTSGVTFENVSTKAVYGNGDVDTYINWTGSGGDQLELFAGGISFIHLIEGAGNGIAFNQDSNDIDWRVESNDHTHALAVDGGTNKVRIENYTSCTSLETDATGIISCGTDSDTVFDSTNVTWINESNTFTENQIMENNLTVDMIVFEDDAGHNIESNSTCVIIQGDTSKMYIC